MYSSNLKIKVTSPCNTYLESYFSPHYLFSHCNSIFVYALTEKLNYQSSWPGCWAIPDSLHLGTFHPGPAGWRRKESHPVHGGAPQNLIKLPLCTFTLPKISLEEKVVTEPFLNNKYKQFSNSQCSTFRILLVVIRAILAALSWSLDKADFWSSVWLGGQTWSKNWGQQMGKAEGSSTSKMRKPQHKISMESHGMVDVSWCFMQWRQLLFLHFSRRWGVRNQG